MLKIAKNATIPALLTQKELMVEEFSAGTWSPLEQDFCSFLRFPRFFQHLLKKLTVNGYSSKYNSFFFVNVIFIYDRLLSFFFADII